MGRNSIRVVDLFAGIGGLRLGVQQGLEEQGYTPEIVFTSEIKKTAIQVLNSNWDDEQIHGDITQIHENQIPEHDLLLAGFPCQAFSYAGKRLGFKDETKGTLFFDVARILKHHKPSYFILENVEGLIKHDPDPENPKEPTGRTLKTILKVLDRLGYNTEWELFNATNFGVPQSRKRIFIVGKLKHLGEPDLGTITTTQSKPLKSILESNVKEKDPKLVMFSELLKKEYKTLNVLVGKIFRDWRGGERNIHSWNFNFKGKTTSQERTLLETLMVESKRNRWVTTGAVKVGEGYPLTVKQIQTFFSAPEPQLTETLNRLTSMGYLKKDGKTYRISSGKLTMPVSHILDPGTYANTLVATDGDRLAVLDKGVLRRFTDTEVKRLFGFPVNFKLPTTLQRTQTFDLFGNSVVVPVAKSVTTTLIPKI